MNRQPKSPKMTRNTIHLDAALLAELDAMAQTNGLSRSGMIAQLVRRALEHRGAL